jgi:hypothetical protein
MNSYVKTALLALVAIVSFATISAVHAQMASTMPIIYSQSGSAVNTGSGYLPAGYYYLAGGLATGGHQIQYYGNGTFYDPSIQQYGGNVSNTNGTAGVSLGYAMTWTPNGSEVALMPALFNQTGMQVNKTTSYLNAGRYYLSTGGLQVEYYGNGTYYNSAIGQYGGSVTNSNGTAGVSLGYSA